MAQKLDEVGGGVRFVGSDGGWITGRMVDKAPVLPVGTVLVRRHHTGELFAVPVAQLSKHSDEPIPEP